MGEAALELDQASPGDEHGWGLRLAQQAFAALLEDNRLPSSFRTASLRVLSRARLTALSVDDRGRLQRWLALQIATGSASAASKVLDSLSTIDALMTANVRTELPAVLFSLGLRLADAADPDSRRRVSRAMSRPIRGVDAAGLPPAGRPSMLSTLFR